MMKKINVNIIKNKKTKLSLLLVLSLLVAKESFAEITPQGVLADPRVKEVPYQKNNVVPIVGQAFVSTQIIFGDDESILDVQSGDQAGWTLHIDKSVPNILTLKPTLFNSNSNLSVITNDTSGEKRIYRFQLMMGNQLAANKKQAIYAIEFFYPDKDQKKLDATLDVLQQQKTAIQNALRQPQDYHWNYSFNGSISIMPLHVFDDGRFTYLQLRPGQKVPTVFAVNNASGEESVVNIRKDGDYLIIQEVAPQFTLREGEYKVVSLFNNDAITKEIKGGNV